jgi:AAA family ATP:ADP antiporter
VNEPQAGASARMGPLTRVLRLFARVQPGEAGDVLLLTLNVFLLLTAYYLIKPVREALILSEWGPEAKTAASAGQALLLLAVVPLYSRLANRMPSRRLIGVVMVFFAMCLAVFYLLARAGIPVGIPFYLWVGIFNLMVIAQFWSFANDLYQPEEGKRLFAIVAFGSSAGAVFGSVIAGRLIGPLGLHQLLLVSAALLPASLGLTRVVDARRRRAAKRPATALPARADEPMSGPGGFALVMRNRYLLMIGGMLVLANLVNTTGEYILGARVRQHQDRLHPAVVRTVDMSDETYAAESALRNTAVGQGIGRFYADFFSAVNLASLVIQLFLVSRIVAWFGVRRAMLALPLVAMGGYALIALFPLLNVARWSKVAENSTDYSLQNTVRQMLFLPTTREEKYKAKQAVDTFFVRMGDVAAAGLVIGGTSLAGWAPSTFARVNIVLAALWVVLAVATGRRFARLERERIQGDRQPIR